MPPPNNPGKNACATGTTTLSGISILPYTPAISIHNRLGWVVRISASTRMTVAVLNPRAPAEVNATVLVGGTQGAHASQTVSIATR